MIDVERWKTLNNSRHLICPNHVPVIKKTIRPRVVRATKKRETKDGEEEDEDEDEDEEEEEEEEEERREENIMEGQLSQSVCQRVCV